MLNFNTQEISVSCSSFPNGEVSGNDNNTNAAVSRDVDLNGDGFAADTHTSSFQPCEASCNKRALLQQREEDLLKELASLKAQCHEKDKEIVYLKDKLSELKILGQRKETEFEQKMEETEQELKAAFFINGNFAKRNSEFEELKKELQTKKEKKLKLKAMGSKLREEVDSLRQGLGGIRQEIFHGNMSFSQQAVCLQNLLTSFQGHTTLSNAGKRRVCKSEDYLLKNGSGLNQFPKDEKRNVEVKEESGPKDKMYSECAVFRAEEYFEFQQSEFDFLTNIVIANGPFRAAPRTVPKEITRAESSTFDQEPGALGQTKTTPVNGDQSSKREICSTLYKKPVNGSCNFTDPRPVPPRGVTTNADFTAPLTNQKAAGSTAKMWHPHYSPPKSTPGYLNNRPLPANSPVDTYRISKTQRATRYLNNRPLPPDSNVAGTHLSSWKPKTEEQGGFFGRTLSQWFGF